MRGSPQRSKVGNASWKFDVHCSSSDGHSDVHLLESGDADICQPCMPGKAHDSAVESDCESPGMAEALADSLNDDLGFLMSLGVKLERGSLATRGAGGWPGYEGLTGDWLTPVLTGGLAIIARDLTDPSGRARLEQMREKWFHVWITLNQSQLRALMAALRRKNPLLVGQIRGLWQPGGQNAEPTHVGQTCSLNEDAITSVPN